MPLLSDRKRVPSGREAIFMRRLGSGIHSTECCVHDDAQASKDLSLASCTMTHAWMDLGRLVKRATAAELHGSSLASRCESICTRGHCIR